MALSLPEVSDADLEDDDGWSDSYGFDLRPLLDISPEARAIVEKMSAAMRTPLAPGDPRLHHYVARSYQRRFADGDEIARIALDDPGRAEVLSTKVVGVMRDLYTTIDKEVGETVAIEHVLAQVDGDVVGVMDRLALGVLFPPQRADRLKLGLWASLQRLRTPAMRRQYEAMGDSLLKMQFSLVSDEETARAHLRVTKGAEPTGEEVDVLLGMVADMESWEVTPHQNEMVRMMLDAGLRATPFFLGRLFSVFKFPEPGLLISDNPVALHQYPQNRSQWMGLGLATADEIWIPLDRSTALLLHSNAELGEFHRAVPGGYTVDHVNQIVVSQADREIYCHPDDVWRLDALNLPTANRPLLQVDCGWMEPATDGVNKAPTRKKHHRYRSAKGRSSPDGEDLS